MGMVYGLLLAAMFYETYRMDGENNNIFYGMCKMPTRKKIRSMLI